MSEYLPVAIGFAQREAIMIPHLLTYQQMNHANKTSSTCSTKSSVKTDFEFLQRSPISNNNRMPMSIKDYNQIMLPQRRITFEDLWKSLVGVLTGYYFFSDKDARKSTYLKILFDSSLVPNIKHYWTSFFRDTKNFKKLMLWSFVFEFDC